MKRIAVQSPLILVILFSFVPLCHLIAYIGGYEFTLRLADLWIAVMGILSIAIIFTLSEASPEMDRTNILLCTLCLPLSFLNGICFISANQNYSAAVFSIACCICASKLQRKSAPADIARKMNSLCSALMIAGLGLCSLMILLGGSIGTQTTIQSISSPGSSYSAEVITWDRGTLGGDMVVQVSRRDRDLDLLLFRFSGKPETIYSGDLSEAQNLQVSFAGETTLLINGTAYEILK